MDALNFVCLIVMLLGGCGLDMSSAHPWVPIEEVGGVLAAERVAPPMAGPLRSLHVPTSDPLRVVTYNVQYGPDPMAIATAIVAEPDLAAASVIAIQEIESYTSEGSSRAAQLAAQLELGYVYVPAREVPGGTHGLAILSAFPIVEASRMELPESAHLTAHRIAVQVTLELPDGSPLTLIDVHLDTMLNTAQRIAQLSPAVVDAPETTVVVGDFNTSWVQWVGGSVPVLSSNGATDQAPVIDDYMRNLGFATPTENSGPTESMFGLEQRLDAIYTRGTGVMFGGVRRVGPSDHWPMWVDVTASQ